MLHNLRAILLKNYIPISRLKEDRVSSYPYISGDTFRSISNIVIDDLSTNFVENIKLQINYIINQPSVLKNNQIIIFVELSCINSETNQELLLSVASDIFQSIPSSTKQKIKIKYIFHNGDRVPSKSFYEMLLSYCHKIFSVNVHDELANLIPLPIGIENYHIAQNGSLKNLTKNVIIRNNQILSSLNKNILIFACFNTNTNPKSRDPLAKLTVRYGYSFHKNLSKAKFSNMLSQALFTLCPVGNGMDTHRIWESLAVGSVPVVLKGSIANSLTDQLPIHCVNSWESFLSLKPEYLKNLYANYSKKTILKMYFDYWESLIQDS